MTENVTYCDKHVSSQKCIFFVVSEPSYSSPRGLPLPRLPRLRVVPFIGLAVVHRCGALSAAWSMWSTTDFHRKSTIRGEANRWVHGSHKEVPPYYAENNYSSP